MSTWRARQEEEIAAGKKNKANSVMSLGLRGGKARARGAQEWDWEHEEVFTGNSQDNSSDEDDGPPNRSQRRSQNKKQKQSSSRKTSRRSLDKVSTHSNPSPSKPHSRASSRVPSRAPSIVPGDNDGKDEVDQADSDVKPIPITELELDETVWKTQLSATSTTLMASKSVSMAELDEEGHYKFGRPESGRLLPGPGPSAMQSRSSSVGPFLLRASDRNNSEPMSHDLSDRRVSSRFSTGRKDQPLRSSIQQTQAQADPFSAVGKEEYAKLKADADVLLGLGLNVGTGTGSEHGFGVARDADDKRDTPTDGIAAGSSLSPSATHANVDLANLLHSQSLIQRTDAKFKPLKDQVSLFSSLLGSAFENDLDAPSSSTVSHVVSTTTTTPAQLSVVDTATAISTDISTTAYANANQWQQRTQEALDVSEHESGSQPQSHKSAGEAPYGKGKSKSITNQILSSGDADAGAETPVEADMTINMATSNSSVVDEATTSLLTSSFVDEADIEGVAEALAVQSARSHSRSPPPDSERSLELIPRSSEIGNKNAQVTAPQEAHLLKETSEHQEVVAESRKPNEVVIKKKEKSGDVVAKVKDKQGKTKTKAATKKGKVPSKVTKEKRKGKGKGKGAEKKSKRKLKTKSKVAKSSDASVETEDESESGSDSDDDNDDDDETYGGELEEESEETGVETEVEAEESSVRGGGLLEEEASVDIDNDGGDDNDNDQNDSSSQIQTQPSEGDETATTETTTSTRPLSHLRIAVAANSPHSPPNAKGAKGKEKDKPADRTRPFSSPSKSSASHHQSKPNGEAFIGASRKRIKSANAIGEVRHSPSPSNIAPRPSSNSRSRSASGRPTSATATATASRPKSPLPPPDTVPRGAALSPAVAAEQGVRTRPLSPISRVGPTKVPSSLALAPYQSGLGADSDSDHRSAAAEDLLKSFSQLLIQEAAHEQDVEAMLHERLVRLRNDRIKRNIPLISPAAGTCPDGLGAIISSDAMEARNKEAEATLLSEKKERAKAERLLRLASASASASSSTTPVTNAGSSKGGKRVNINVSSDRDQDADPERKGSSKGDLQRSPSKRPQQGHGESLSQPDVLVKQASIVMDPDTTARETVEAERSLISLVESELSYNDDGNDTNANDPQYLYSMLRTASSSAPGSPNREQSLLFSNLEGDFLSFEGAYAQQHLSPAQLRAKIRQMIPPLRLSGLFMDDEWDFSSDSARAQRRVALRLLLKDLGLDIHDPVQEAAIEELLLSGGDLEDDDLDPNNARRAHDIARGQSKSRGGNETRDQDQDQDDYFVGEDVEGGAEESGKSDALSREEAQEGDLTRGVNGEDGSMPFLALGHGMTLTERNLMKIATAARQKALGRLVRSEYRYELPS
jgi:hypothetical protein